MTSKSFLPQSNGKYRNTPFMSHYEMHQISAFPVQEHHKQPSQTVHACMGVCGVAEPVDNPCRNTERSSEIGGRLRHHSKRLTWLVGNSVRCGTLSNFEDELLAWMATETLVCVHQPLECSWFLRRSGVQLSELES